ncbi:MAG: 8-oxoguanine deaminase [Anaerolineales bacterium]|jgi:cytosine/adenosine deaminase-related metal-dependent hydrolase|nr:8-oxoguanine deaminase [Anaerolineales bacterium]HJO34431.1 8-oxoguanine deaminase [Anaerolineales bacterium]
MGALAIRNAEILVTMDEQRREMPGGGMIVRDGMIESVRGSEEMQHVEAETLDLGGHLVFPGLVNTHHHLYQTLTRAVPRAQDADLFDWLRTLYPIWARLTPEAVYVSALVGMAELLLSGCTTSSDHLYVFPNGARLDDTIYAAQEIGIRFHPTRGSMSLGESAGGLPPDSVVESERAILDDSRRVIESFHDPERGAMLRVALAPCSPFSVTADVMRASADMARDYGVRLHTHLAETVDEERFCVEKFGRKPVAYANELGWVGDDVWFAHMVHLDTKEIEAFAGSGCGVAHCPTSNMRLASGIAPVQALRLAGVDVGLGVDGSASNDGSHMLAEARQAMLLARLRLAESGEKGDGNGGTQLRAREALELATLGGAAVLGRDDVGSLQAGNCADFFAIRTDRLAFAGALHDPVAAAVLCAPQQADVVVVNGKVVVKEGQLNTVELCPLIERHNRIAAAMVNA